MNWDWVTDLCVQIWKHMGRKLLKAVQTITTFRNPLADPVGTRRGPHLVRGPQFENRWTIAYYCVAICLVLILYFHPAQSGPSYSGPAFSL